MTQPVTCAILLLLGGCATQYDPKLTSAAPDHDIAGGLISLSGTDLCDGDCDTAAGEVLFGLGSTPLRAQVEMFDDDTVILTVPSFAPDGPTQIVVSVRDKSTNALDFTVDHTNTP
jgi:hypothetical protein